MSLDAEIRAAKRAGDADRAHLNVLRRRRGDKLTELGWITMEGRAVAIVDMDDKHLVNTIAFLTRGNPGWLRTEQRARVFEAMKDEAKQRGLSYE